jgi:hypothetical protein
MRLVEVPVGVLGVVVLHQCEEKEGVAGGEEAGAEEEESKKSKQV